MMKQLKNRIFFESIYIKDFSIYQESFEDSNLILIEGEDEKNRKKKYRRKYRGKIKGYM